MRSKTYPSTNRDPKQAKDSNQQRRRSSLFGRKKAQVTSSMKKAETEGVTNATVPVHRSHKQSRKWLLLSPEPPSSPEPSAKIAVPLMTQDEMKHAKKNCQSSARSSARRLHKIKRRLLLDIAEEQNRNEKMHNKGKDMISSTIESKGSPSEESSKAPTTRRRNRRTRTASFMGHTQSSDSTMETFFGESSSSLGSGRTASLENFPPTSNKNDDG